MILDDDKLFINIKPFTIKNSNEVEDYVLSVINSSTNITIHNEDKWFKFWFNSVMLSCHEKCTGFSSDVIYDKLRDEYKLSDIKINETIKNIIFYIFKLKTETTLIATFNIENILELYKFENGRYINQNIPS